MVTEPKIKPRKKQNYVAIRMGVPIPFGKYLQPAWNEVYEWLMSKKIKPSGPALIRYLTTDMSKELDIDVGFIVDQAAKGDDRVTADFLPAGKYATLLYTGPYKGKGVFKATVTLLDWAKANKIKWDVTRRGGVERWNGRTEFYFSDPAVDKDSKNFKTELAFKVKG
jgi:effector-binding domain-containing protein